MHWAIVFQIIILFNLHNYLLFWSHFCKWGNSVLMKLSGMDTIWQSKEHTVWHCRARYFCGELYCTVLDFGLYSLDVMAITLSARLWKPKVASGIARSPPGEERICSILRIIDLISLISNLMLLATIIYCLL